MMTAEDSGNHEAQREDGANKEQINDGNDEYINIDEGTDMDGDCAEEDTEVCCPN